MPSREERGSWEFLKEVEGFRKWGKYALRAGRLDPAWDAGMDTRGMGGDDLLSSRNAVRGINRMYRLREVLVGRAHVGGTDPGCSL